MPELPTRSDLLASQYSGDIYLYSLQYVEEVKEKLIQQILYNRMSILAGQSWLLHSVPDNTGYDLWGINKHKIIALLEEAGYEASEEGNSIRYKLKDEEA